MTKTALIDGDSFLYRAGFAVEKTKYLVTGKTPDGAGSEYQEVASKKEADEEAKRLNVSQIWSRRELGNLSDAVAIFEGFIRRALDATKCVDYHLYLTAATGNFRDSICTLRKYKGDRPPRPVYYSDLREHAMSTHGAIVSRGEEADDNISWVARQYFRNQGREYVIVGIDKDLMQIPGDHYNWVDDEHKNLSDDEARLWYWAQVLAGDTGDNVGGCWGLGLAKASKFLVQCNGLSDDEMWPKVVRKYKESQKLPDCPYHDKKAEEVALETLRLIRLRQAMDEELWTPPKQKKDEKIVKEDTNESRSAKSAEGTERTQ